MYSLHLREARAQQSKDAAVQDSMVSLGQVDGHAFLRICGGKSSTSSSPACSHHLPSLCHPALLGLENLSAILSLVRGFSEPAKASLPLFSWVPRLWRPVSLGVSLLSRAHPSQPAEGRSLKPRGHRGVTWRRGECLLRPYDAFSAVWCLTAHPGCCPRPGHPWEP